MFNISFEALRENLNGVDAPKEWSELCTYFENEKATWIPLRTVLELTGVEFTLVAMGGNASVVRDLKIQFAFECVWRIAKQFEEPNSVKLLEDVKSWIDSDADLIPDGMYELVKECRLYTGADGLVVKLAEMVAMGDDHSLSIARGCQELTKIYSRRERALQFVSLFEILK
jgi:hypothetical protein